MMSSTTPSAKYSCSGSPLMFVNGSTAMEGLSGSGSGFGSLAELRKATAVYRIRPDRLVNVFDMLLAEIRIGQRQRLSHVTVSRA